MCIYILEFVVAMLPYSCTLLALSGVFSYQGVFTSYHIYSSDWLVFLMAQQGPVNVLAPWASKFNGPMG